MTNILIAIPAYGGNVQAACMLSILDLHDLLNKRGILHAIATCTNQSSIICARNHFANMAAFDSAKGQRFSSLLFIDSDSVFEAKDILTLIDTNRPISALPYAVKAVNWKSVGQAARLDVPDNLLEQYAGDVNINTANLAVDGSVEPVDQVGTGTILIASTVLDAFVTKWPERKYRLHDMDIGNVTLDGNKRDFGFAFFREGIHPKSRLYMSEDFQFLEDAKLLGFSAHVLSNAVTGHIGKFEYVQSLGLLKSTGIDSRRIFKQPQESNPAATAASNIDMQMRNSR
jgi:hypothetical protein